MFSPDLEHDALFRRGPLLAFDPARPLQPQREAIAEKLRRALGDTPEATDPAPECTLTETTDEWSEYRIVFNAEKNVKAVCTFLLPTGVDQAPLAVCLQGHSTGMHISLGRTVFPNDAIDGDRDIALTAVRRGFAALCLEQRGMGERRTDRSDVRIPDTGSPRCRYTAMNALLLGRTLIGERLFDISRAIDVVLSLFSCVDPERILCMGNSGGGTATYYAACMDERIGVAIPSCSVCTYRDSIAAMYHCPCNYLPGAAKYFDMGDLAALIAPRRLIVVAGAEDGIFPLQGVQKSARTIKAIYEAAGVPERFSLVVGEGGHRFYKELAWAAFDRMRPWG